MRSEAEYNNYLRKCIRCSFCQPVCPLFAELREESTLARAKVRLAKDFTIGKLQQTVRLKELFSLCLDCRACESVCPANIPVHEIVQEMRGKLQNVSSPDKKLYKTAGAVLTRPRLARSLASTIITIGNKLNRGGNFSLTKKVVPLARQAGEVFPSITEVPFLKGLKRSNQAEDTDQKKKVGYFVGCATNYFYPHVAQAAVKVLGKNGYHVLIPHETICCGLPLYSGGEHQSARKLAAQVIEQFQDLKAEVIVTDCAGCSLHLKEYGRLWPDIPGSVEFSSRIQDISWFIVQEKLKTGPYPVPWNVTYHDPCHLGRAQGIYAEPRQVLTGIKGLNLIEMEESNRCCGGSGLFSLTKPELSTRVLARKLQNIKKTGTGLVATSCPSCRIQLERGIKHQVVEQVVHPVELMAKTWDEGVNK